MTCENCIHFDICNENADGNIVELMKEPCFRFVDKDSLVEVKHGRWKGAGMGDYRCSLCCEIVSGNNHNFCPNCGADMRERKNDGTAQV